MTYRIGDYTWHRIYKTAKAIYLMTDLEHAYHYLDWLVEANRMTEEDADKMLDKMSRECASMTMAEIDKIKAMF